MGLFKAYDIRGIYGSELTEEIAYKLGKALVLYLKNKKLSINPIKNVVIGYDSRVSNLKLFSALAKSITEENIDVIHVGLVSRPMLNWAAWNYKYELGIIISASHNPKEYNGFKFILNGRPLSYDNGLNEVEKIFNNKIPSMKSFKGKKGKIISKDYIEDYVKFLSSKLSKDFTDKIKKEMTGKIKNKKPIKIIADATNGSAGEIIKRFFEKNEIDGNVIFAEPDGRFPCHNPNPLDNNALVVLRNTVIKEKADFGFIVDPDADRIRFVDEKGQIVDNGYSASLVAKYLLNLKENKNKNKFIIHDLVARKILSEIIRRNDGKELISRVGFANIYDCMEKNNGIFGAESSGHFSFKDMHYLDSGMMMLVNFINMLYSENNYGKKLSSLVKPLNKYVDLGEQNYALKNDSEKRKIMQNILDYFRKEKKNKKSKLKIKKIMTLDGISVYFRDYWMNIRPSNTEPLLRLRAEGKNIKELDKLKKLVEKFIEKK